jgi:hypothetical protein
MKILMLVLVLLLLAHQSPAQELNCQVRVIAPNVQTTDPKVFETLQQSVSEFLNNRKWTGGVYKPEERIECSMLITISQELSTDKFSAQLTIQSNRPVLNSSYNSPVLYLVDKDFAFQYAQYQPLEFNENQYQDNLTAVLAFYAYIIIGLDENTFAPKGGGLEFQKANSIVTAAQSFAAAGPGWKAYDGTRNRYWLVNNLTNTKIDYIHEVFYKYHRNGLDKMYENSNDARRPILEALNIMSQLKEDAPNAMITQVFFQTKGDELVNIFSKATPQEKSQAVQICSQLDASNSPKYQQILKSN